MFPLSYRYDGDQSFDQVQINGINAMEIIDGKWYVVVKGDYAGRVSGTVFDISNSSNPVNMTTEVRCLARSVDTAL